MDEVSLRSLTNDDILEFSISKRKDGFYVISKTTGKNLGGPYKTKEEAQKRLKQVEFFKNRKKAFSLKNDISAALIKDIEIK